MAVLRLQNGNYVTKQNTICDVKLTSGSTAEQYTLPFDVVITLSGSKMISKSQILDGVMVFERVTRQPFDINFDFTLRQVNTEQNTITGRGTSLVVGQTNRWVFPTDELNSFFQRVWVKDSVLRVDNDLLNNLGLFNIIVESVNINTIRGNVDVPVSLKCFEDFYSVNNQGQSLLI